MAMQLVIASSTRSNRRTYAGAMGGVRFLIFGSQTGSIDVGIGKVGL